MCFAKSGNKCHKMTSLKKRRNIKPLAKKSEFASKGTKHFSTDGRDKSKKSAIFTKFYFFKKPLDGLLLKNIAENAESVNSFLIFQGRIDRICLMSAPELTYRSRHFFSCRVCRRMCPFLSTHLTKKQKNYIINDVYMLLMRCGRSA